MSIKKTKSDDAWEKILDTYPIVDEVKDNDFYIISSDTIGKFREARLMAKWDCNEHLPKPLKKNKINLLPISRGEYILGKFSLYKKLPEFSANNFVINKFELPHFESIDIDNINSESTAINALHLTNILNDFLETDELYKTFDGRMGTGKFSFFVDTTDKKKLEVNVDKAQIEIDAGFESKSDVVIIEAKNVLNDNFHIRQLYYPYRTLRKKVNKNIRLIFSIYSNKIFRLYEYKFTDDMNYSSIKLIKEKYYSLDNTKISKEDILFIAKKEKIKFIDKNIKKPPFPQADSMHRIINLMEKLYDNPLDKIKISEELEFTLRQANYYYNAGVYLGIFKKYSKYGELTELGMSLCNMNYSKRQLQIVKLVLQHDVFNKVYKDFIDKKFVLDNSKVARKKIVGVMSVLLEDSYNLTTYYRRSSTVLSWIKWIEELH